MISDLIKVCVIMACIVSLPYCLSYGESPWFVSPVGSYLIPSPTSIVYRGYSGTAYFKDGYAAGLQAGRTFGNWRLGLETSYEEYYSKSITLNIPRYGQMFQGYIDLAHSYALLFFADYTLPLRYGFDLRGGVGAGASFDDTISAVYEARLAVDRKLGKRTLLSLGYTYRHAEGKETWSDISEKEPDAQAIKLSISKKF